MKEDILSRLSALLLVLCMMLAVAACSDGYDEYDYEDDYEDDNPASAQFGGGEHAGADNVGPPSSDDSSWAVYWYLCGSDLETGGGFASGDIEEMMSVSLPENITVVVGAGGALEWENGFDPDYQTRCVYDADGFRVVDEIPAANMGDPRTMADFLAFCNENYPADKRAVIFWNHGGGSVAGIAFDELYDYDSLDLNEVSAAFSAADFGGKYELIGFDACLMATVDVAATVAEYAGWMVASQETEPGCGWDYERIFRALSGNTAINGGELGVAICDAFYAGCEDIDQADGVTLSVIDLSKVNDLVYAYNAMGCEALMMAGNDTTYFNFYGRAAIGAENYGGNSKSEGYTNMVDLGDLIRQANSVSLFPIFGEIVLYALDEAVYYSIKGPLRSRASGLSVYHNYNGDYYNYIDFAQLAASPAFAYFYEYALTGQPTAEMFEYVFEWESDYSTESVEPVEPQTVVRPDADSLNDYPVYITDDGIAVLDLGRQIADQLVGVYFDLAYYDDESGMMILLGMDNDLNQDWENGIFKDNFRGIWGAIGGALVYMELTDEADEYQIYAVPVLLGGEEYTLIVSYIFESEEYSILGARSGIDDHGMSGKSIRPLIPGDVVEPLLYVIYDIESDDDIETIPVGRVVVTADTVFEEIDLGDGTFVFLFEMVDFNNNSYLSEAVFIGVEDGEIYLW